MPPEHVHTFLCGPLLSGFLSLLISIPHSHFPPHVGDGSQVCDAYLLFYVYDKRVVLSWECAFNLRSWYCDHSYCPVLSSFSTAFRVLLRGPE